MPGRFGHLTIDDLDSFTVLYKDRKEDSAVGYDLDFVRMFIEELTDRLPHKKIPVVITGIFIFSFYCSNPFIWFSPFNMSLPSSIISPLIIYNDWPSSTLIDSTALAKSI